MRISLFVEISRLTIEYTAWNSRRCNIFFTVWWNTYCKINACARSQNDNNDNFDSTNVSISDVQLLLFDCRRKQRRSIIITRLSSRTATLKSCARRSSTIITRLKDEYINWWRERENDIINLDSQNSFYQSFPVLQMLLHDQWNQHWLYLNFKAIENIVWRNEYFFIINHRHRYEEEINDENSSCFFVFNHKLYALYLTY